MKIYLLIFVCIITVLSTVAGAKNEADSRSLIQNQVYGFIDWTQGVALARGIGIPAKKEYSNPDKRSPRTISEAKNRARVNLLETIKKIRINSENSVGHLVLNSDSILTQLKKMVYDAPEIENLRKYMSDGTVEVYLQMKLNGGFAQLVLPQDIRQIESIKRLSSTEHSPQQQPAAEIKSEAFTGLVVDARGISINPALAPRLLDENLQEVFGPTFVSREFAVQQGMVAYTTDICSASSCPRVAENPLIVKALKTAEPGGCDLIISDADAARLHSASEHLAFLKQCRVVIVVDAL